jgi:hypothetical protein
MLNIPTGVLLLIAKATQFVVNPAFYLKMIAIVIAVSIFFVMRARVFRDPLLDEKPLQTSSRILALASVGFWLLAIIAGRAMAYVGEAAQFLQPMNPNVVHFHLVANHVPTVGLVVALSLLLVALAKRGEELKRVSLGVFFVIALITLPVYISGSATDIAVADLPEISATVVRIHKDAALVAFAFMGVVGGLAWVGLWQDRRTSRLPQWNVAAVLLLAALTLTLMARTATLGGEIRHPEMSVPAAEEPAVPGAGWLTSTAVASFVITYAWVWQASETVHFIGMCLLMASSWQ